jgi:branched-chain amino acid transport system substrate-binding protein
MRQKLGAMCIMCVLLWLAGCTEPEHIRLGFLGGLTGRFADFGTAGRNGALLAVEMQNQLGGIGGRQIELLIRDDMQDPGVAKLAVDDLLKKRVVAIIGPMLSSIAVAVIPKMNDAHVVMMGATVTTTMLSGIDDYFFRVSGSTADYASYSARYHHERLGLRRAALLLDASNREYTESWVNDYQKFFESLGGTVVLKKPFDSRDENVDYHEIARLLLADEVDVIALACSYKEAAIIIQAVRKLNTKVQLSGAAFAGTERLIELAGLASEGMLVEQFTDLSSSTPTYQNFLKKYISRFGHEPGFAGTSGYDATRAILAALAMDTNPDKLKETLLNMKKFQGSQSEIVFDEHGDAVRQPYYFVIRDGRFVLLN